METSEKTTAEVVKNGLVRLHAQHATTTTRVHISKAKFANWANGRILLDADETKEMFRNFHPMIIDTMLLNIEIQLRRLESHYGLKPVLARDLSGQLAVALTLPRFRMLMITIDE